MHQWRFNGFFVRRIGFWRTRLIQSGIEISITANISVFSLEIRFNVDTIVSCIARWLSGKRKLSFLVWVLKLEVACQTALNCDLQIATVVVVCTLFAMRKLAEALLDNCVDHCLHVVDGRCRYVRLVAVWYNFDVERKRLSLEWRVILQLDGELGYKLTVMTWISAI